MHLMLLRSAFVSFAVIASTPNCYAGVEEVEGATQASIEQWDFVCVSVEEFSKVDGGGDNFKLNNFVVNEGTPLDAPHLPLKPLEIAFSVTNRTTKNVAWSAEFLGFGKDKLPSFAMSVSPPAQFAPPQETRTFSNRIQVRSGTLERTALICLRVMGDH